MHRLDKRPWAQDGADPQFDLSSRQQCISCHRRSDHEGDLFAALAKGDESGDPARVFCLAAKCWEAKTLAYIKALLINNSEALPLLSGRWPHPSKAALAALAASLGVDRIYAAWNDWRICHDDDAPGLEAHGYERRRGVVVNNDDTGELVDAWVLMQESTKEDREAEKTKRQEKYKKEKEEREKNKLKENAFRAVMKKLLPEKIPAELTAEKMLSLAYNWAIYSPKEELRNANPKKIMQDLWKCVRERLSQDVYYVNNPTPKAERKAICEYCGLDADKMEADIKEEIAKAEAAEKKVKKARPAEPKEEEEEE
jgi:hypothetical protein